MKTSNPTPLKINAYTGMAIVVANMIGTGVFTSLGFQVVDLNNTTVILMLWLLGGIFALAGAFSYAEIGTVIQKSGGEYAFLSKIFHPSIGYLSGWLSITVGFTAPIALSAMALVEYFPLSIAYTKTVSVALLFIITFIHTKSLRTKSRFQNTSTFLKVLLILIFILAGLLISPNSTLATDEAASGSFFTELTSPAFAVALIFVSYAYSGWNAAAYIVEELEKPVYSLPFAIVGGTLLVTVLYIMLQYIFLKHVPLAELAGQIDVGAIAAKKMFGEQIGDIFGLIISLFLVSGISAMIWVGPRVTTSMANDYWPWSYFKVKNNEVPHRALWFQFAISTILLVTGTFEQVLVYCGLLLTISAMITVCGVFLIRRQKKYAGAGSFKSPFYPLFQLLFLLISVWMIAFATIQNTFESMLGMINLLAGWILWKLSNHYNKSQTKT